MNSQKPKGAYHTYNNPKRAAYHEAGHVVTLFLLTGELSIVHYQKRRGDFQQAFSTVEEYQQILKEVCYWVAGGVAEKVHCQLKGLPQITMEGDIDTLLSFAKHDWHFPFKQKKTGYPGCPILENMVKTAADLIESLFRSSELFTVKNVANFLISQEAVGVSHLDWVQKDSGVKRDLLKLLMVSNQELKYCLSL